MSDKEQDWHSSKEFNDLVKEYHDKHARQPQVADAKNKLEQLKGEIRNQMETQGLFKCMEFKHKGSTYEGVKITSSNSSCPEFDLDFVMRGGEFLEAQVSDPHNAWHELKVKQNKKHELLVLEKSQEGGVISPEKIMQFFHGSLIKCDFVHQNNIKLRYHGPAVQLDVHNPGSNDLWFQVDLAPAFYLEGTNRADKFSECYIAKSPSDDKTIKNAWYRSYSADEKKLMDKAEGQRKVVLRTLKALRGNSSQFSGLTSYQLKTVLFDIMEKFPENMYWSVDRIGQRIIDMLIQIDNYLELGYMPNYFNKNINILKLSPEARGNLKNYISKLVASEAKMNKLLSSPAKDSEHSSQSQ